MVILNTSESNSSLLSHPWERDSRNPFNLNFRYYLVAFVAVLLLGSSSGVANRSNFSEMLLSAVTSQYGSDATRRMLQWERLIVNGRTATELDKLETVNNFFNALGFRTDAEHWGESDYWATPIELLGTRAGDCEDFSIAKYFTLKEMGIPEERLRVTYVKAHRLRQAHMVLAYYPEPGADPLILDNLDPKIRAGSERTDLTPVYSFNGEGLWMAQQRGQGRRIGRPTGISLWRDLSGRMQAEGLKADHAGSWLREAAAAQ